MDAILLARLHPHITAFRFCRRIHLPVWYIEMDAILLAANIFSVPEPNPAPLAASCHQHLVKIATNIEYRIGLEQSCTVI
jgi:hypothetical protein